MNRKLYTFLIVAPHGKLRKIQIPFYALHLVLGFGLVSLVILAALANSYARMLLKISNYNELRTEQNALKRQYRTLENVVSHTNAKLNSLESLAGEVALSYGFGGAQRLRFPQAVVALAIQSNSTLESSYKVSLYAFNLMKTTAFTPSSYSVTRGLFSLARYEPLSSFSSDPSAIPSIWPVRGQITGGFGQRMDPLSGEGAFHAGVDISAPRGTEIQATADGVVVDAGPEAGYGNEILLDHGSGMTTKYCHLSKIYVIVGQEVKRGEVIGTVGMTGRTTGPHLHYEVLVHETPVNPAKYLRG